MSLVFFFYGRFFPQFVYLFIHKLNHLGFSPLPELELGINL